jgi:hypothetical protein
MQHFLMILTSSSWALARSEPDNDFNSLSLTSLMIRALSITSLHEPNLTGRAACYSSPTDLVLAALECGGADCCWFVVDDGGSGHLIGWVVLAPDSPSKMLGGLLWLMFLSSRPYPVLQDWWVLWLINALWLGVSLVPKCGPATCALLLLRQRCKIWVLSSCSEDGLQLFNRLFTNCFLLLVCIWSMYCYCYEYK